MSAQVSAFLPGLSWFRRQLTIARHGNSYLALMRQRRDLGNLEDHILHDIGVSRECAEAEAARPVWDVPCWWR